MRRAEAERQKMGTDRKSKEKRSSSLSASEDEGKHRKRHRREDEDDDDGDDRERRRSRNNEQKEKRKDKRSHKHRSDKEKKSKDKHKAKPHKRHHLPKFQELSKDDYFSKNNEFATWLFEEKNVFFSDLSSESAREMFSDFIKDWNNQKLESRYYEGISSGPRSAHNWSFKK